ncbi:UDP-N-acetylglucosamine 1-carboxyvinyltransferase [Blastococcus sp. MG754426]|uniref:UDP-N-acetylglucosamine 1-carboxyvinyltransferase n=1 Tax=unclassified Blastococcus TaxID=2619396 RepID=UPI001EEFF26C|nr:MULTISPECIES: UDP-N-acetylglucosamine 1-carboxyvinyltransferase [unclassified Blastococcus]MCF6508170.1 UDP-N-acetylglucosamine 1-carboxyvinyltransferase [Blastococcus sp. MG754426]MCF6512747.1 UDP-N-acetylglucosamine 1-carboxyvinyltransferase [Blastococcus sp. MG754427]MCF6734263.1 UDP-N-acetylglucosamine 1-carboxyvinyltransferase [Blastococcus sp. KM273129]
MTLTDQPADEAVRRIGALVRDARRHRGLTQQQLAERLGTSQSAVARIEQGSQNLTLEFLGRLSAALDSELIRLGPAGPAHLRVTGGHPLRGRVAVKSSKNAAVALLCASLLNRGRTTLRNVSRIVEVERILDVLRSIGVSATWDEHGHDLTLVVPDELDLEGIDADAARRTRSIIMFLGPLLHRARSFRLPYAGGCDLGTRTVQPHMIALRPFGLSVEAHAGEYQAGVDGPAAADRTIVLTERGDTVTENALLAAARTDGTTTIRNASSNYMVQDLCLYLELLGVGIEGMGSTTLVVRGRPVLDADVDYTISEDPVEAMSLLTAGIVTGSELTVARAPVDFLEVELAVLAEMGLRYELSAEYLADNGHTRLADITIHPSELQAPLDKVHPMPFPGLNIDNLPFFAVIAAQAQGSTLIHDWVYDNRAIHLSDLTRLGADVRLLDPHRVLVTGPTRWRAAEVVCPPALRPAVCILLAMLAAKGTSVLRNVDIIARGYEQLYERLVEMGAEIEVFRD